MFAAWIALTTAAVVLPLSLAHALKIKRPLVLRVLRPALLDCCESTNGGNAPINCRPALGLADLLTVLSVCHSVMNLPLRYFLTRWAGGNPCGFLRPAVS